MLALYPQMADADALTQTRLINAWFRRQQLAARLIAIEVGKLFGGGDAPGGYEMIDEDAALAALGVTPKRYDVRDNATTG